MPDQRDQDRRDQDRSPKYLARQQVILREAVAVFNHLGVGGATLGDVAKRVGLNMTGVRYYYRQKDDLVGAAFNDAFDVFERLIADAQAGATASERVDRLIRAYVRKRRDVATGDAPDYIHFSDLRAFQAPQAETVTPRFAVMFRAIRTLLTDGDWRTQDRQVLNARAHVLLSHLLWAVVWLLSYSPDEYDRAADHMLDILRNGLAPSGAVWAPEPVEAGEPETAEGESRKVDAFLKAATIAINANGYHNASIDSISAQLNVTKGSFYHHLGGKGELVAACFRRSFAIVQQAQRKAREGPGGGLTQSINAAAGLVRRQLTPAGPLLRTSALTSVLPPLRREMTREAADCSRRFADMVTDGILDGSARTCDAAIAGHMITAIVNAAEEAERWIPGVTAGNVVNLSLRPLYCGLLAPMGAGRSAPE